MKPAEIDIIYLEDEGLVARETLRLLGELGYAAVTHHRRWATAETALADRTFDLAILDVNLAGSALDGIDIGGVLNARYAMPIVVTTSHSDERTLTRLAALPFAQYVHKPFTAGQLGASLQRALKTAPPRPVAAAGSGTDHSFLAEHAANTRFVRGSARSLERVDFTDILYMAADRSYTDVYLQTGGKHTLDTGIRAAIDLFQRDDLLQIHKSYAVPYHAVVRLTRDELEVKSGKRLPVGRTFRPGLKEALGV